MKSNQFSQFLELCNRHRTTWERIRCLKINRGILDEGRMHKHTYEAYKIMIKVEIKLLQFV
jgi:hypothetical protein